jgi:hypothetical protein
MIQWKGLQPGLPVDAQATVLQKSVEYVDGLEQGGDLTGHGFFLNLTAPGGFAVLQGPIDRLIDLPKDPGYREWLLTCQTTLAGFQVITAIGGTNGEVEAILRQQQHVQQDVLRESRAYADDTQGNTQQTTRQGTQQGARQSRRAFSMAST